MRVVAQEQRHVDLVDPRGCKVCQVYEHDRMDPTDVTPPGEAVQSCMACMSWWHEACMSPADRATLPDMPVENVEDGVVQVTVDSALADDQHTSVRATLSSDPNST